MTEKAINQEQLEDIEHVKHLYTKFKSPEAKLAIYKLWWVLIYHRQRGQQDSDIR